MKGENRVRGLDSLRFVLAFWVVLGHNGLFPLMEGIDSTSRIGWLIGGVYRACFNGPAAVIVFFVISGFCIHFPYRHGERLCLVQYYPRRYLRILLPLGLAIAIVDQANISMPLFGDSILWSIVCEEVYYFIYPLLLSMRRRLGWAWLLGISFLASIAVVWTSPAAGNYPSYGWQLNWVVGLPCWLLGCNLSERSDLLHEPVSRRAIWLWRFGVWAASVICLGLRFHTPVGFPHTLNWFAVLAFFWLGQEIRFFRNSPPPSVLEWAGRWSYSLYLMHVPANLMFVDWAVPNLGYILNWVMQYAWTLGICYCFYVVVEKPSHLLARWVGRRLGNDRAAEVIGGWTQVSHVSP